MPKGIYIQEAAQAVQGGGAETLSGLTDVTLTSPSNGEVLTYLGGNWINSGVTGGDITPAALTKVDDTNVTLTLGGSPTTSLLQATSLTLGWTGTLADGRIASASTWNGKQDALTFGIADTNTVVINSTTVADNEYARFTSSGLESRSTSEVLSDIGAAPTSHAVNASTYGYGDATNAGHLRTGTGILVSSGTISVSYGTGLGTACIGNDIRLSNSRTPTSHSIDSSTYHSINDVTTFDASTSNHGFLKKLNNSSTQYMNGQGNWATPPNTNYYPTTFTWSNGTTSGPTGSLTGSGMSAVSYSAIPSATDTISGIVTTGTQIFGGVKRFSNVQIGYTDGTDTWKLRILNEDDSNGMLMDAFSATQAWSDTAGSPLPIAYIRNRTIGQYNYAAIRLQATPTSNTVATVLLASEAINNGHGARFHVKIAGTTNNVYYTPLSIDYDSNIQWKRVSGDITHQFIEGGTTKVTMGWDSSETAFVISYGTSLSSSGRIAYVNDYLVYLYGASSAGFYLNAATTNAQLYLDSYTGYDSRIFFRENGAARVILGYDTGINAFQIHTSSAYTSLASADFSISDAGYIYMGNLRSVSNTNYLRHNLTTGEVTYYSSDARLKKNIRDFDVNAIEVLSSFKPRTFEWVAEDDDKTSNGWIAQEGVEYIENMFPVVEKTGLYSISEGEILPYFHKAIMELKEEIEKLKAQLK